MFYEVAWKYVIKNGVLVRCEVCFGRDGDASVLNCGLDFYFIFYIFFVLVGICLLYCNR